MKVRLGDYIEQIRGVSYSPADLHSALNEKSVILLRANNINDNKINFDDVVFVDKSKVSKKQYLQEGDILVCASSGSKHLVGKAAYMDKAQPVTFGAFCKIVRPKTSIKRYIGYFFESPFYRTRISELSGGANINNIKNEHIDNLEFELLEDRTQNDICSKLNKISFIIDKRKQQLEKLDLLVKSKFKEMFGGISKDSYIALNELCSIITDGTHQPPRFSERGIPFLFVSNLSNNDIDYNAQKFISQETYEELIKRTPIEIGDVLLSTVGSYGHPAVVTEKRKFCFQRHIAYLKPRSDLIDSRYLFGVLLSSIGQEQIEERVKGIAQKTLNLSEVRKIKIPLPPMEQQKQYTAFYQQINKPKIKIKQSLEKFDILKKALMQKYFG